jgi:hypothetical protein
VRQGTDCDTGHLMVVAEVKERLAINKKSLNNLI